MTTILPPIHTSPETAYTIDDYPYGYRLRCRRRVWLESNKDGTKFRLVSQTTDPRRGDRWNKPKKSTYAYLAAVLYLDDEGHVQWSGFSQYTDSRETQQYLDRWEPGLSEQMNRNLHYWLEAKRLWETRHEYRAGGQRGGAQ